MDPSMTLGIMGQYTCSISALRSALKSSSPVLYIIGQVSLGELTHWCKANPGCILFVQGLPGFNVVEMLDNGQLQEATREQVLEVCKEHRCLLFNLTAVDCIKVGFDELQTLFDECIPKGRGKEVLNAYRASSFGSFAASMSRGKIKVRGPEVRMIAVTLAVVMPAHNMGGHQSRLPSTAGLGVHILWFRAIFIY